MESTIHSLSEEQKIRQIFCTIAYTDNEKYLKGIAAGEFGGLMCRTMKSEELLNLTRILQQNSKIPMLVAGNMEAGVQAANAGMDVDMGTGIYKNTLQQAVESGKVPMSVIDEAVERILSVKMWRGLFEHPYVDENTMDRYENLPEEHTDLAVRRRRSPLRC